MIARIAALFVEYGGVYYGQGLDCWDVDRDARDYAGPMPVIAHPPCKRWGRYWSGGPSAKIRRHLGDDNGCFATALWAVRTFGGVLEHPEASKAWDYYGLVRPHRSGGWLGPDSYGGYSCCVEQGHYGHKARKATWLYAVNTSRPELRWGPSEGKARMDSGYHSREERTTSYREPAPRLSASERLSTPIEFRDLLIGLIP